MSSRAPLARAIAFGLSAGLVLGGLSLLFFVVKREVAGVDCSGLSVSECALEGSVNAELFRMQGISGVVLTVMGLALFIYSRRSDEGDA